MDAMNHCLASIARLQKEVQNASSYTTPHDQRIYSDAIKALQEKLSVTRSSLAPKSKFSFKSSLKKNDSAISLTEAAELALHLKTKPLSYSNDSSTRQSSFAPTPAAVTTPPNEPAKPAEPLRRGSLGMFLDTAGMKAKPPPPPSSRTTRKMSFSKSTAVNIASLSRSHVMLPSSAAHATSSGSLTDLQDCIIDMSLPTTGGHPFAGLHVRNVSRSLLICGNVAGAAHVTGVRGSVILVAARQFRMHECADCVVYLRVSSRPIIEDCTGIRFAPMPEEYVSVSVRGCSAT